MPSQHTSGALNTEHNEGQRDNAVGRDRVLSNTPTLLQPDTDIEDEKTELSHGVLVNLNIDTSADVKCIKLEECASPLQPAEIMEISETDTNDAWDAIYNTLLDEISPSNANEKLELPFNPDIEQMDEEGYTPLYKAALEGHLEGVDDLISRGANPNKPSESGLSPLHAAAQEGHAHIVDFLILQGADVNVKSEGGRTPLYSAAANGYVDILESFIAGEAKVNVKDNTGWTPFNAVVQYGHLEAIKYLLTKGAEQNRFDGMTPVYAAAYFGHLDIIKFFISNGADVNEEDDKGMIPLHGAASGGHIEVIEYLIQQGSDVNRKDNIGWTAFNATVQYGHYRAVKYLMSKGAKQNRFDGMTPVYAAAYFGHLDIIKFFISNGADVNEEDDKGMIPLHGAASGGHIEVIEYLIKQGSDVNKNDCRGWTPLHAAVKNGHSEVVKFLMAKGAKGTRFNRLTLLYIATLYDHIDVVRFLVSNGYDVNDRNECGKSPLHAACYNGNMDIVKVFVHHNANVSEQDHDGWTPLHAAAQEGHQDIVDYLTSKEADMNPNEIDGLTPLIAAVNAGHTQVIDCISLHRGGPDEEKTGDLRTDIAKRGDDELSLKNIPITTQGDEKGGNGEPEADHNPFIHAKLKYPDKGEQHPMLDHMEAIKCTETRKRDAITNGTECSSPHGLQTWQYSGLDKSYLQTMETDGHSSGEPESRYHPLIDENKDMRESSSPMNAGNDLPISETSVKFESFLTHPPAVVHHQLYDRNPVSTQGTSSNLVWTFGTKRRISVDRCPSILARVQTFMQVIIAVAIILPGSLVLVAGSDITERVTLQAGKPGVVPFHLPWPPNITSRGFSSFTLGFKSEPRPFCINGEADIEGFKRSSQLTRFKTSVTDLDTSLCVNLIIDDVETVDEGVYILKTEWHSFEIVWQEIMVKELLVQVPPGPAKCFITLSENANYPYEVHCRATTGSVTATLSCYQNGRRVDAKGDVKDNGLITRRIFWLPDNTHFSCCSHDVSLNVSDKMCNDFEWPHVTETRGWTVNTVHTSVTTPTPQIESHTESGACRQFMRPSLWHFSYLFVYFLAFVKM